MLYVSAFVVVCTVDLEMCVCVLYGCGFNCVCVYCCVYVQYDCGVICKCCMVVFVCVHCMVMNLCEYASRTVCVVFCRFEWVCVLLIAWYMALVLCEFLCLIIETLPDKIFKKMQ